MVLKYLDGPSPEGRLLGGPVAGALDRTLGRDRRLARHPHAMNALGYNRRVLDAFELASGTLFTGPPEYTDVSERGIRGRPRGNCSWGAGGRATRRRRRRRPGTVGTRRPAR